MHFAKTVICRNDMDWEPKCWGGLNKFPPGDMESEACRKLGKILQLSALKGKFDHLARGHRIQKMILY